MCENLNMLFSETTGPFVTKFCMIVSIYVNRNKMCSYDAGHMTKVAVMPLYCKNAAKSSSPEPAGRITRNLVHVGSIGDSCQS